jgi:intein/homing endonuclease
MNIESISSENLNKELAYLFGVYLTDGSISYEESYTFSLKAIDRDFVENSLNSYKRINPNCTAKVSIQLPRDRYWDNGTVSKTQIQYCIHVGFSQFGNFFKNQTGEKHHIPFIIWNASDIIKRHFISGVMDGDGWISKTERKLYPGTFQYRIGIGGVEEGWIWEFEKILHDLGVNTLKREICIQDRIKPFIRFAIGIESFVSRGLFFTINRKQQRLLSYIKGRSETKRCAPDGVKI